MVRFVWLEEFVWVVEDLLYGDRLEADILALRCVIAGELLQA